MAVVIMLLSYVWAIAYNKVPTYHDAVLPPYDIFTYLQPSIRVAGGVVMLLSS